MTTAAAKRVDIISLRMVKESSVLYPPRRVITPRDAVSLLSGFLDGWDREAFLVAYLNTKNEPTAIHTVSVGTLNSSLVHPREVYKGALLTNAASVILAHNHPSGVADPSAADITLTRALKDALNLVDVRVLDHFIVAGTHPPLSLAERGQV